VFKRPTVAGLLPAIAVFAVLAISFLLPTHGTAPGSLTSYLGGSCTSVNLTANPSSPHAPNGSVLLTGNATCSGTPTYRFWVRAPGGAWTIAQDYSTTNTYNWPVTGLALGTYGLEVDARNQFDTGAYDVVANLSYDLTGCSMASLTASPPSPHANSGTVVLTGNASCPGTPTYRFWVRPPGGAWGIVQDYGTSSTYNWSLTALVAGSYGLEVDVRDQGSSAVYETVSNLTYTVTGGPACNTPTLSPSPASPGATGSTVVFTATTSGCPSPRYRFWVLPPGGPWAIVQDYSASNTFSWSATGRMGSYGIEVDVRDASETVAYDAVRNITYQLNGCSAAAISETPSGSAPHSTNVTLTGTATCPGTATYRFWVKAPGGAWTMVRDYGASNTYIWAAPATPGTYLLEVDVRDLGSTETWEQHANTSYILT
jgi:hypothetical protein